MADQPCFLRIRIERSGQELGDQIRSAETFLTRFRGLLFTSPLPPGAGLLLPKCSVVHMFWMTYPIDILFLDNENVVVDWEKCLKPWRVSKLVRTARSILELPAGRIRECDVQIGDRLQIERRDGHVERI